VNFKVIKTFFKFFSPFLASVIKIVFIFVQKKELILANFNNPTCVIVRVKVASIELFQTKPSFELSSNKQNLNLGVCAIVVVAQKRYSEQSITSTQFITSQSYNN